MTVLVAVAALVFCGVFGYVISRQADARAAADRAHYRDLYMLHMRAVSEVVAAGEANVTSAATAIGNAIQTSLTPPTPSRDLSAHEVARELYEQGVVPTLNDPTDDTDPTDYFYPAANRPDVAFASNDDPSPFGVPGVRYTGNGAADDGAELAQMYQFPPPKAP